MKSKKIKPVTFRTTEETYKKLVETADKHEWSVSQLIDKILKNYVEQETKQN